MRAEPWLGATPHGDHLGHVALAVLDDLVDERIVDLFADVTGIRPSTRRLPAKPRASARSVSTLIRIRLVACRAGHSHQIADDARAMPIQKVTRGRGALKNVRRLT